MALFIINQPAGDTSKQCLRMIYTMTNVGPDGAATRLVGRKYALGKADELCEGIRSLVAAMQDCRG